MDLKWYPSQSEVEPVLVDETSSDEVTIVRKNVHTVQVTNEDGSVSTLFAYDEAMPSKTEYAMYLVHLENVEAHNLIELAVAEMAESMA